MGMDEEVGRTELGYPDTRLGRAVDALQRRKAASYGISTEQAMEMGAAPATTEQVKVGTADLDVDIDEALDAGGMVASEGYPVTQYRPDLTMNVLVGTWIDGVLVGVLHERERMLAYVQAALERAEVGDAEEAEAILLDALRKAQDG